MCVPWDMPKPNRMDINLCDSSGNLCFYSKMKNETFLSQFCKCYPSCNSVKYSYTEKQAPISTEEECDRSSHGFLYSVAKSQDIIPLLTTAKEKLERNIKWSWAFNIKKDLDISENIRNWCQTSFKKDIAIIEVEIADQSFVKMRQSIKTTLGAKVGELGGTLGLFTGFSFMAFVEIIYWVLLTAKKIINFY